MSISLNIPRLALPKNFVKRRQAILNWFRRMDEQLAAYVEAGSLQIEMAQTYFKFKVESNPDLSKEDKQTLACESKVWKMPV